MNCPSCKTKYTTPHNVPRLLVFCGHSLCEQCLKQVLATEGQARCFECAKSQKTTDIGIFPKNLALIDFTSGGDTHRSISVSQRGNKIVEGNPHVCVTHGSKFEAFCNKKKILLCIQCILDDKSKEHELTSIEDAYLREAVALKTAEAKLIEERDTLEDIECQIQDHLECLDGAYKEKKQSVERFFTELRTLIDVREKECLEECKQEFNFQTERTMSYKAAVEQKRSSYSDSLGIIKEIREIKDKIIVLGQAKELFTLLDMNFKSIKQESLTLSFKEFKPDIELKALLKHQSPVESKPIQTAKSKTPKYTREAYNKKDLEGSTAENSRPFSKAGQDSPKPGVIVSTQQSNEVSAASKNVKTPNLQPAVHQEVTRSLTTRDKNKHQYEPSRDKSTRKDIKTTGFGAKDKRKENMPPKLAQQTTVGLSSSQVNKPSQKPAKNYSKKLEDARPKTSMSNKEAGLAELGKISLTSSISKEVENTENTDRSAVSMSTQGLKLNSQREENLQQPALIKKITDLDKARALKKAASKNIAATGEEKMSTPSKIGVAKEDISHKSWSKSINKKVVVDKDSSMISENHSLRLTDIKPHLMPEANSPGFLIIGGYGSDPETELPLATYNTVNSSWSHLTSTSSFVKSSVVKVGPKKVWIVGGKAKGQRLSSITELDTTTGKMIQLPVNLQRPKSAAGSVVLDGLLYVVGGNSGESVLAEMDIINIQTLEVKKGPAMNSKRDEVGLAVGEDNNIYAFGGYGGSSNDYLSTCERFNPKKNKWEMISSMKRPRRSLCCVTCPDAIYCLAGYDGKSYLSTVEKYDVASNTWSEVNSMKVGRCFTGACLSQDSQYIFVFGGYDGKPVDSVEKYNLIEGIWENAPSLPEKRFMHCCLETE